MTDVPESVVLEREGVGDLGVPLATTTAPSELELLCVIGRWALLDVDSSSKTTASSLEFRLVGQKIPEADLDGARRVWACVSTVFLEEKDESERVGIGGNAASSGSVVVFFVPQIDVSERVGTGRSASDVFTDASFSSFFLKLHQEPVFCTLIVSVWVLSMPPVNSCQSRNVMIIDVEIY